MHLGVGVTEQSSSHRLKYRITSTLINSSLWTESAASLSHVGDRTQYAIDNRLCDSDKTSALAMSGKLIQNYSIP